MERLTKTMSCPDGTKIYDISNEIFKLNTSRADKTKMILEKLAEYEDLEEQGRLIKLPCKVGDNIYIVKRYGVEEAHVIGISEADDVDCFCFKVYIDPDCYEIVALEEFEDEWFLTESEAEAKLKELRGEDND